MPSGPAGRAEAVADARGEAASQEPPLLPALPRIGGTQTHAMTVTHVMRRSERKREKRSTNTGTGCSDPDGRFLKRAIPERPEAGPSSERGARAAGRRLFALLELETPKEMPSSRLLPRAHDSSPRNRPEKAPPATPERPETRAPRVAPGAPMRKVAFLRRGPDAKPRKLTLSFDSDRGHSPQRVSEAAENTGARGEYSPAVTCSV